MVTAAELPKGLTYIRDTQHGFIRKKRGRGFTFFDQNKQKLTDESQLERIRNLVIPPAWKNVWISPKKSSYLQATGMDEKGRKQYLYHAKWSEYSQKLKFDDLLKFGLYLPKLRARYNHDLRQKSWNKKKVLALATALLDELHLRVGNKQYTQANKTHGLTTLRRKHLHEDGSKLMINYTAKSGKERSVSLSNRKLIRLLKDCSQLPGYELFRYQQDHEWHNVNSSELNEYISLETTESEYYTAKYFRTWGANCLCIQQVEHVEKLCEGNRKKPETTLIKLVAEKMGHTQAVCKNSYLHPEILSYCLEKQAIKNCLPKNFSPDHYKAEEVELLKILCTKLN
ncbi:DNA topoisomerase IB [Algoriphagus halophytocola]|uniref:DNA topoisomerase n=1 Tax=Algoriphagus halophytocola TaxID=2991499 RepID=A0ABY6MJQ9_9BACT|nr:MULTISPECIES: DNA topoisomerase IB [unclassified Algoriphagus]UZD23413.1 DNA topoisomerase IB [Algoriphagus sp. TR-M5]WBL44708.1 DNA topoisomerase IB [Algoriphagus sp. TR-M9]